MSILQKQKGPASAPTLPGRGSTYPHQEEEMNISTISMPPPEGATRTDTTIDAYNALVEVSALLRVIFLVADSSALADDRDRSGLQFLLMRLEDRLETAKSLIRAEIDEWGAEQ